MHDLRAMAAQALSEIEGVFAKVSPEATETLLNEVLHARRIATYGVGREGLMMKALCMRLFHLGLDAHVVGDMTTPPLSDGDLLLVSAGPGHFFTVEGLVRAARQAKARTLCFTAQPQGTVPQLCDVIVYLPAQTMANDQGEATSILPMGSLYEAVLMVFADLISILLRERLGQDPAQMRLRHTNLE
ncbi:MULTISPECIES: SIS domain-containing protein [Thermaceae]|uniref:Sugar isomerase (SIS) n=1 Tax=Allomeiothermus silvanus (strain ATCC 700542 / DSM 9946 / NBRC 106475 / NCIMB 13440 / VI-R2) TaxID=526227 RepID=D7BE34_ALLS1|nr:MULTISPECIES: SIS domain-containing protein [Thermaceae]ADH64892.1 sugar isomerase (SIS) [Allomeiothermus silvanus DSM 9946]PZA07504.1 SIS domain-containing protein [Meiothermus sp. Pnk-1]